MTDICKLYTVVEAAEFLRVSERTMRSYIANNMVPYVRIQGAKKILIRDDDLQRFLRSHTQKEVDAKEAKVAAKEADKKTKK